MTRRGSTPEPPERDSDSGPSSIADVRVRMGRRDLGKVLDALYKASAILFWGFTGTVVLRAAPGAYAVVRDATVAMTRVSVALERASDTTARIEAATTDLRAEVREARAEQRAQGARLEALLQGCGRR